MQIISQDRATSLPYSGATLNQKDSCTTQVIALMPSGSGKVIAEYSDYDKAREVLRELAVNNGSRQNDWLYYMPPDDEYRKMQGYKPLTDAVKEKAAL